MNLLKSHNPRQAVGPWARPYGEQRRSPLTLAQRRRLSLRVGKLTVKGDYNMSILCLKLGHLFRDVFKLGQNEYLRCERCHLTKVHHQDS